MKKIRVLQMIDQPFLGGGQRHLLSLARSLDRRRFEVAVCSRGGGPLVEELRSSGIPHFPVGFQKTVSRTLIRDIRGILETHRFDILHTHGGVAGLYGRWAARKSRVPAIVHTLHGIHYLYYRNPFQKIAYIRLERFLSRFTDAVIFVSDADRDKGEKYRLAPKSAMKVIKNGIDFSAFSSQASRSALSEEFPDSSGGPVLGTVARLHRQKGLEFFIRGAGEILREIPSADIWIIGDGPLRSSLQKLIEELGLTRQVHLLGGRQHIQAYLARFDAMVLPSLWEGLPYVLLEAAALAKPVVATAIDGIEELIEDEKTGLLVPVGDPLMLAKAAVRVLRDRNLAARLGERLRERVSQTYTLERMVDQIQWSYEEIYTNRQRSAQGRIDN